MRIKNRWVSIKFIRILLTRPNDTSRVIYHRLCSTLSCSLINHNLSPFPLPSHHQEASRKLPKKRFPSRHNNIAIRRALRSNLTSTFHPHPTLSEWKKKKKTTGAIIKKCTTTIFEVSHSVVHPTLKTVYFLQTPNEKQQKKKKEAEWNNVNNRIPQQTTFFLLSSPARYTVDVRASALFFPSTLQLRTLRIIIPFCCRVSLFPSHPSPAFLPWLRRKLYCYLHFPMIWKPVSKRARGGGGQAGSKHFPFSSTQYLYSATTNTWVGWRSEKI